MSRLGSSTDEALDFREFLLVTSSSAALGVPRVNRGRPRCVVGVLGSAPMLANRCIICSCFLTTACSVTLALASIRTRNLYRQAHAVRISLTSYAQVSSTALVSPRPALHPQVHTCIRRQCSVVSWTSFGMSQTCGMLLSHFCITLCCFCFFFYAW